MGSQLYPLHIPHREIQTGKQIILNRKENEKYARKSDGKFVSNVSSSNDGTSTRSRFPLFPLQPPLRAFFPLLIHPWIVLPLTKVNKTKKKRKLRRVRESLSAFTDYIEELSPRFQSSWFEVQVNISHLLRLVYS